MFNTIAHMHDKSSNLLFVCCLLFVSQFVVVVVVVVVVVFVVVCFCCFSVVVVAVWLLVCGDVCLFCSVCTTPQFAKICFSVLLNVFVFLLLLPHWEHEQLR